MHFENIKSPAIYVCSDIICIYFEATRIFKFFVQIHLKYEQFDYFSFLRLYLKKKKKKFFVELDDFSFDDLTIQILKVLYIYI